MQPRFAAPFCAAATALLALGLAVPSAGAGDDVGFIAGASGQGFRSTYVVPGQFVVEQVYDFGGPVAQSQVDPSGGTAFGSLPFPGEAAIVAPGLAANLAGLPSPPAAYPFYARAQYPSVPSTKVSDPSGNYQVSAAADAESAISSAIGRGGPKEAALSSSEAHTTIKRAGGKVTATAETSAQGISLGGVLTIGSAVSRSATTLTDGALERTSELVLNGLMVAGTPVGMGPDGLDDQAANDVLKNAGVQVRIAHHRQSDYGATADVLEIVVSHPVPGGGGAIGRMVYRFGGASTEILTGSATEEGSTEPDSVDDGATPPGATAATSAAAARVLVRSAQAAQSARSPR